MLDHPLQDTEDWVILFSNSSLPILRHTKRQLDEMRADMEHLDPRHLAHVILQDPIMAVRVMAYIQPLRGHTLQHDITTIAGAVMMAGVEPFFHRFSELPTIEGMLEGEDPQALLGVLKIIRRAQRATQYAHDWAAWRHDINIEEVRVATLLHDLAEILVWCFAPKLGLQIRAEQLAQPGMRSAAAQAKVLGFTLQELQLALCRAWHLPELLRQLINDDNATHPRVRNVTLAVRLARHSAQGWDDPALPDDYRDIGEWLHMTPEAVQERLGLGNSKPLQPIPDSSSSVHPPVEDNPT